MFTRFVYPNDFHLLSTNTRGAVASRLKRLFSIQVISGSNPGSVSFSNHTLVCNYAYQVDLSK